MKEVKETYLTGVEDVDKYFVENYDLIDDIQIIEHIDNIQIDRHKRWFVYLREILSQEQFKAYVENNYPEGYKKYAKPTHNKTPDFILEPLTKTLILKHVWIDQIAETICSGERIFDGFTNNMFLRLILKKTDDKSIIRLLTNHNDHDISSRAKQKLKTLL